MYFCRFPLYNSTIRENKICERKYYASSKKSGRDGQDPTTGVLFCERHLPLPWTGIRGAPLLQCLGAWGSMVPHCECRCCLCGMASPVARLAWNLLDTATRSVRVGNRAWIDECLLLSRDLPHSIRNGWSYRVHWSDYLGGAWGTDSSQHRCIDSGCGRRMALDGCPLRGKPLGFVFAFANCAFFMLYVVLGHRIAQDGGATGIDRLGAAMLIALVMITPIGITGALPAMVQPPLLLAGIGVGVCSSVIPYVSDQLAMARLKRSTFALLLSLLPASATVIGILVLRQIPTLIEVIGILLVAGGVALHQESDTRPKNRQSVPEDDPLSSEKSERDMEQDTSPIANKSLTISATENSPMFSSLLHKSFF
jgi:hypothetical protein